MIYWTPICGKYFLDCSILKKCGKIWKNGRYSERLQPDWGNTAWAATAGLGSKGLSNISCTFFMYSIDSVPQEGQVACHHGDAQTNKATKRDYRVGPLISPLHNADKAWVGPPIG